MAPVFAPTFEVVKTEGRAAFVRFSALVSPFTGASSHFVFAVSFFIGRTVIEMWSEFLVDKIKWLPVFIKPLVELTSLRARLVVNILVEIIIRYEQHIFRSCVLDHLGIVVTIETIKDPGNQECFFKLFEQPHIVRNDFLLLNFPNIDLLFTEHPVRENAVRLVAQFQIMHQRFNDPLSLERLIKSIFHRHIASVEHNLLERFRLGL